MEKESGLSCIFPFRWGDVGNAVMVSILSFFFYAVGQMASDPLSLDRINFFLKRINLLVLPCSLFLILVSYSLYYFLVGGLRILVSYSTSPIHLQV